MIPEAAQLELIKTKICTDMDFLWLTYDFEASAVCCQMSQALKKYCTVGLFFVEFSGKTNCF